MRPNLYRGHVAKNRTSSSAGQSSSGGTAHADSYLYGGAAAIVGILGLVIGAGYALLGNTDVGPILAGVGVVLLVAGFLVARRRQ